MSRLKSAIDGVIFFESKVHKDDRGEFELIWDTKMQAVGGATFIPESVCHSTNRKENTLRGLHYQAHPHCQAKVVSCVTGALWDVVVDMRVDSQTYLKWQGTKLREGSGSAIYIPAGCAHGYVTLKDNTSVEYLIMGDYVPAASKVLRWDDPLLNISWPIRNPILSSRDQRTLFIKK